VDLTSLTVAVTVGTTRRLRITGSVGFTSTVGDVATVVIKEGATQLNVGQVQVQSAASLTVTASVVLTPTSGSHTYKLAARRETGSGNVQMNANATNPAFILVEDIGPAS
jgi:hypothetical protein